MNTTLAFVLTHLKYGDSSGIFHFYTKDYGIVSGISKGAFSPKKNSQKNAFFPLNQIELTFYPNSKSDLKTLKSIQPVKSYQTLHVWHSKIAMVQFLAEMLYISLKESEPNSALFNYLENQFNLLDEKQTNFADFHLVFLFRLTQFLGFYPNLEKNSNGTFDLLEGQNIMTTNGNTTLSAEENMLWQKLANAAFNASSPNLFNQAQRKLLIELLVQYYEIHQSEFRKPKSLEILNLLF